MGQKTSLGINVRKKFKHKCKNLNKQDYKDVVRVLDMNNEPEGIQSASQQPN